VGGSDRLRPLSRVGAVVDLRDGLRRLRTALHAGHGEGDQLPSLPAWTLSLHSTFAAAIVPTIVLASVLRNNGILPLCLELIWWVSLEVSAADGSRSLSSEPDVA
jgi:hypothetical protein